MENEADFRKEIIDFNPDLIISDYSMPAFDGMTALKIKIQINNTIPFIILTGSMNEETAVACMKAGADDYVIKENLHRLVPAIELAFQKHANVQAIEAAKNALKESELRFKSIFKDNLAVMLVIDPDNHNIVDANQAAENYYGWGLEQLLQKKLDDINAFPSADITSAIGNTREQKQVQFEFKHKKGDGSICDVEIFPSKIEIFNKEYIHLIVHDISERKKVQEELIQSEEKHRHLIENMQEGLIVVDNNDVIQLVNPIFCEMLGYEENELIGKVGNEILLNEADKEFILQKNRNRIKGISERYELNMLKKSGEQITLQMLASSMNDANGIVVGSMAVCFDITERKKAEEKIIILSRAVEQSPTSVIITNQDGAIQYVNAKFCDITGYTKEEVIGKNPRILKSGQHDKNFYENLWDTILTGKDWHGEILNKKKSGELFWGNTQISPVVNENGDINNFVAVIENITGKKKIIEELIVAKRKAETLDKMKTEFLAQMSHEIRTPLNAMMNYTSFLKDDLSADKSKELSEIFESISDSGSRIVRTIDMILNASELQVGGYDYIEKKIDIYGEIIKRVCRDLRHFLESKKLKLRITKLTENTSVLCDEYSIYQTLLNLIDNAIKYTEEGFVDVRLLRNDEDNLQIEIEDTGIGISEKYIDHLFDAFSQEETGYSRKFEGTGLGLSIVKKYCELNRIRIDVKSKKKVGTTFTLTFSE
ncbi:MAG: PAS domain S-box protein [Ignavibacteria bacterium]|nr:PAS domain S-box protein [Ignavibacteria bacterium]